MEESQAKAKKIVDEALSEIESKRKEALTSLKEQIANIAVDAAEKIIRSEVDAKKHSAVLNNFLNDLKN